MNPENRAVIAYPRFSRRLLIYPSFSVAPLLSRPHLLRPKVDLAVTRYPPTASPPLDRDMEEEEVLLGRPAMPKHHRKHKQHFPTLPRLRTTVTFLVKALFSGLLFYYILSLLVFSRPSLHKGYLYDEAYTTVTMDSPPLPTNLEEKPPGLNANGLLEMSPDELRAMIATTNGYFARDWSLYLGWNNVSGHCLAMSHVQR